MMLMLLAGVHVVQLTLLLCLLLRVMAGGAWHPHRRAYTRAEPRTLRVGGVLLCRLLLGLMGRHGKGRLSVEILLLWRRGGGLRSTMSAA